MYHFKFKCVHEAAQNFHLHKKSQINVWVKQKVNKEIKTFCKISPTENNIKKKHQENN